MQAIIQSKPINGSPDADELAERQAASRAVVFERSFAGIISALADHTIGEQPVAAARPHWQSEPCPAWCGVVHKDGDYYEDRHHFETFRDIDLTLYQDGTGADRQPGQLVVSANQHYRQAVPEISLVVPTHEPGHAHKVAGETQVDMTMAEARALRDALSLVLAKTGSQCAGGVL